MTPPSPLYIILRIIYAVNINKKLLSIFLLQCRQAYGIINDHERGCFLYKKIMDTHPHAYKLTDG